MNDIKNILKPKSEYEIKEEIRKRLDIEKDIKASDIGYLEKLFKIVTILKSDKPRGKIAYMDFDNVPRENAEESFSSEPSALGEMVVRMEPLTLNLYTKSININKKIKEWKEIYYKVLQRIIKISERMEDEELMQKHEYFSTTWPVLNNFAFASNLIAQKSRYGPATFVLIHPEFHEKHRDQIESQDYLKVVVEETLEGKIIFGRKSNANEAGIFLTKYKNKYSLDVLGVEKNNYISIDV
jgi:hypothetical protein